jgi:hypothetical protein
MTVLLEQLFQRASGLPPELQDVLAREFLLEIERESRWTRPLRDPKTSSTS